MKLSMIWQTYKGPINQDPILRNKGLGEATIYASCVNFVNKFACGSCGECMNIAIVYSFYF